MRKWTHAYTHVYITDNERDEQSIMSDVNIAAESRRKCSLQPVQLLWLPAGR